ncbi:hypothetical protein [Streptomyces sp. NPDC001970]
MARLIPLAVIAIALVVWLKARRKASAASPDHPDVVTDDDVKKAPAALGLVPADRLVTKQVIPTVPHHAAAREAVRSGDWAAGAAFVAEAGRDWYERNRRIGWLADEAAQDDAWLLAWRRERPQDPAAAAIHANALVGVAWDIRGAKRAKYTTQEQFASFHRVLGEARDAFAEAQALAGDDPSPFIGEISVAMGLGYSHEMFAELWAEIEKRDPHSFSAHISALQYWCAKWRGSHELAEDFARRAAAKGEPGELLTLIPLEAYFEYETHENDADPDTYYKRPEIVAAVDAALADVAAAATAGVLEPRDPRILVTRHMLAWLLYWQDRYEEAFEQFREVEAEGHIGCAPWTYSGDPVDRYTNVRDFTAAQVLKNRTH